MFRALIFNRREEIVFIKDHPTFEESLKVLNAEIDERKGTPLSGAYIYKYLNPEQNQSMTMVASLRTTR